MSLRRFLVLLRLSVWLLAGLVVGSVSGHAAERPRADAYQLWLGSDYKLNRSGNLGDSLTWVIMRDGEEVLGRLATNELSYTYYDNAAGSEYFAYLEQWGGQYYVRVSNIVGYRPGVTSDAPIVTSTRAAVAVLGQPFHYVITATGEDLRYTTSALPPGLSLDDQGVISGTPTALGQYTVTLGAASGANTGTAALALSVVSGRNEGGLTDRYTLVLDSSYKVTWNARSDATDLTMVVKRNGAVVLGRNVLGSTRDGYYYNFAGFNFSIHLESLGARVSNIVYYSPGTANGLPLITSPLSAAGTLGLPFAGYQIVAQNAPSSFSATGLPNGLSIDPATGRIGGTPAESGTFYVELAATNAVGTARAKLTLTILAAADPARIFTLVQEADGIVRRSAGDMPGLCWVVIADGQERLRRLAGNEDSLLYHRHAFEPIYTVHLEALVNGAYQRVSNVVGRVPSLAFIGESDLLLRAGQAMAPYTITLNGVYTSLSTGALPAGLSRSGAVISGTPTAPGVYTVALQASSSTATATASLRIEVLPAASGSAPEGTYALSLDRGDLSITRSAGELPALAWVVRNRGEVVLRRNAKGESTFTYHRNFLPGEYTVHLEAAIEGRARRVSNLVGYVTPEHDGAPVFATPRQLVFKAGVNVSLNLLASGSPDSYAASALPAGLGLSASGLLSGTPSIAGLYPVTFYASRGGLTGRSAFQIEIAPATPGASYALRHQLTLQPDLLVVRSAGTDPNLSWVVKRDGVERLNRLAGDELAYRYHRNFEPGAYTVHLEALLDGAYRVVSNTVNYTVGADGASLLAHGLGAVNGKAATYLEPTISVANFPDGRPALALTYTVNRSDSAMRATLETSSDLSTWTEVTPLRRIAGGDETFELREDLVPVPAAASVYRVRIDRAGR